MSTRTVREIRGELRVLGNKEKAAHAQGFFKTGKGEYGEGDKFLGIRVPELRALAKRYKDFSLDKSLDLLHSRWHEERLLALLIMVSIYKRAQSDAERKRVYTAYLANTAHINNWDLVDLSAHLIVGPYLEHRSRKPLYKLAKSKSLWERRIAIIATYHYIRAGDFDDTLAIADRLLHDNEDLIHKAVGWMLREVGNRDRKVEVAFLKTRYPSMPRTMLRYAIEKFPEPTRKRYLKGTV